MPAMVRHWSPRVRGGAGRLRAATAAGGACAVALALLAGSAGCGWSPGRSTPRRAAADDPSPTAAAEALSPRRLVISPLTTVRRSDAADDLLVVHLLLQDGFGQPTKALGTVAVELVRPASSSGSTSRWDVDLRDPQANAAAFDGLVTHTYVLRLRGLEGAGAPGDEGSGRSATVRATFTAVDAGWGESRVLTAEARVGW